MVIIVSTKNGVKSTNNNTFCRFNRTVAVKFKDEAIAIKRNDVETMNANVAGVSGIQLDRKDNQIAYKSSTV
jgi:hypothetical protein